MLKDRLIGFASRFYFWLPISHAQKQKLKFFIYKNLSFLVNSLPSYKIWLNRTSLQQIYDQGPKEAYRYTSITDLEKVDWQNLEKRSSKFSDENTSIDVIIPVYDGYEETLSCIYSVLTSKQQTSYELIVINDKGPNQELNQKLSDLAKLDLFTLYENQENLGFVKTVNLGMNLNLTRDVLLLNSDTEVYNDWLDRIVSCQNSLKKVATITPFSSNAEICSYPALCVDNYRTLEISYPELDKLFAKCNEGKAIEIPTGVGFCMWISREVLNKIGYFDEKEFGKGYGEENDFCFRALAAGYKNILAGSVYVRHLGGVSFSDKKLAAITNAMKVINRLHPGYSEIIAKFVANDEMKKLRRNIDIARITEQKPVVLFMTHSIGGGVERYVNEISTEYEKQGYKVLLCFGTKNKFYLKGKDVSYTPNLQFNIDEIAELKNILSNIDIKLLEVHHYLNLEIVFKELILDTVKERNIPYYVTCHDYFPVCPRINMLNSKGYYCGEPDNAGCNSCIKANGHRVSYDIKPDIEAWRAENYKILRDAEICYVPSNYTKECFVKYYKDLNYQIRKPLEPEYNLNHTTSESNKILILGAIGIHKGFDVLYNCIKYAHKKKLPLQFEIVGYTCNDHLISHYSNVRIHGPYDDKNIVERLKEGNYKYAFIPSVFPETFCYVLSNVLEAGIMPVAFDFAAIGERLRKLNYGKLIPLTDAEDTEKIISVLLG